LPPASPNGWLRTFAILATLVLAVTVLRLAQSFFVIVALAVLIAFVLQPLVTSLQRLGLRRTVAVLISVTVAFSLLGGLAWVFTSQVQGITADWPQYRAAVETKIRAIDPWREEGYLLNQLQDLGQHVMDYLVPAALGILGNVLDAVFIIVLVVFILLWREDLRNRIIRLAGHDHKTALTTKALDDASQRISRFLLMQVVINASFGLLLGLSLLVIGVPRWPLWGLLAALMRFVPYVGTWVGLLLPGLFSLGTSPSLLQPAELVGIFIVLEVLAANVAEPLLFGMSVGASPLALLVSAIFWAWMWGPIGLILSTPMTVCLLVLGRYVPQLEFLEILLGDEPALDVSVNYYQRLLAHDQDEAAAVVEEYLQGRSAEEVFDDVLIPALVLAKRDRGQGDLSEDDEDFLLRATRDLVTDLSLLEIPAPEPAAERAKPPVEPPGDFPLVRILGCPAVDEVDELGLLLFRQLMQRLGADLEVSSAKMLSSEVIEFIDREKPALVVIAAVASGGVAQTRYLCKRLRSRYPELKILVGRWGLKDNVDSTRQRLLAAGATAVGVTMEESRAQVVPLVRTVAHATAEEESKAALAAAQ
jgi:predicted PurR-regulated permease PerM